MCSDAMLPAMTQIINNSMNLGEIPPTVSVINVGVIVDENLSMDKHILKVSRAVCVSNRNIGLIRKHINQPVEEILTHVLITSILDTWNSLLHGLNKTHIKQLQRVKTLLPDCSRYPGNVLILYLSLSIYTGYQSNRESSSKAPCLYSRQSTVSRPFTCVASSH